MWKNNKLLNIVNAIIVSLQEYKKREIIWVLQPTNISLLIIYTFLLHIKRHDCEMV